MTIFSFRADCPHDVDEFEKACKQAGVNVTVTRYPDEAWPDLEVEIETDVTLEILLTAMQTVEDGHVMDQTLRQCPRAENSMERDTGVKRIYPANTSFRKPPNGYNH